MEQKSKVWFLENFNFFSELTVDERNFICKNTEMKSFEKNEPVYFQHSPAKSVYFLKEGKIRVSKYNEQEAEFLIAILGGGEIFGESAVAGKTKRNEVAIAEEKTMLCVMSEEKMKELLLMVPGLNLKFGRMIEERLEKTQKRLEDLTFKNNEERIIGFIKETALKSLKDANNEFVIENSFTHEDIAKLTSTNRQMVSSVMSSLKKKKIIDYDRKNIRILELEKLDC
ncbi:MAG: Crp/Fnr family transcriptional regulator [Bacteroidetes bacterium]|nr:Crp/Fnr family transcriptional regulator [Bacteroidota bacterium]HET6245180.1 Crp/Fnr family transcriptional regulator [Bacteroidia bacterium]